MADLVDELRALVDGVPLPGADWHPYVAAIRACLDDARRSLELVATRPEAVDRLERLVAGGEPGSPEAPPPELREAAERLAALPRPEGQHPFLDEILPALEVAEAALAALS